MKVLILLMLPAVAGCSTYTRAEMDLVTQARRGIAMISKDEQARATATAELARLRRAKLDTAFDEDVRNRASESVIDPDWIIDARRAYALALDAYAKAQAADERVIADRKRNLAAIDAALSKLWSLQSIRLKLDLFANPEEQ